MVDSYMGIAAGSTLANIVNIMTLVDTPPHVMPNAHVPLLGNVKRRALSGKARRDGAVSTSLRWDYLSVANLRTLIYTLQLAYTTAGAQVVATLIDEEGFYSPFLGYADKPQPADDYEFVSEGVHIRSFSLQLFDLQLQSTTYATTHTITSAERLVYGNTGSGGFTFTMPAANGVTVNTIYSVQKSAVANTLTIARAGADTIDGGTSVALTANHSRYDFYSDGVSAWTSL